jgi:hypothetical protein
MNLSERIAAVRRRKLALMQEYEENQRQEKALRAEDARRRIEAARPAMRQLLEKFATHERLRERSGKPAPDC